MIREIPLKLSHRHPYRLDAAPAADVVILGAGSGERLGRGPKALIELGGEPLLLHTIRAMSANRATGSIVVTAPAELIRTFRQLIDGAFPGAHIDVVVGGPTRQASSHAGLTALRPAAPFLSNVILPLNH